jgi:hypothetical protein
MSFTEFYDHIYYGTDMEIKYNGKFYKINSGITVEGVKQLHSIDVNESDACEWECQTPTCITEIYSHSDIDYPKNIELFLNAKIFNDKCVYDISDEIEVISC